MENEPIDVTPEPEGGEQLPARVESGHISPLDMPSEQFRAGLERRGENRKSLMEWVWKALVKGTDYGPIHIVPKAQCSKGRYCENPHHFSKPVLFKPGAEKICGMLGITVTFPTLGDYEQSAINGVAIKDVILRCELISASGQVVAHGVGGRSVSKDNGDLNKTLKMCEKSAHIDATLRMAGLSEIFTQDLEDMVPGEGKPPTANPGATTGHSSPAPAQRPAAKTSQVIPEKATEDQRQRFIKALVPVQEAATECFVKWGWLGVMDSIQNIDIKYVPTSKKRFDSIMADIQAVMDGGKSEEAWRTFRMPFGKDKGTPMGELEKNKLFGWFMNYTVEDTYNGKKKSREQIDDDLMFREMLDRAGEHYEWKRDEDQGNE